MSKACVDAIVVGAGPVGLTMAATLTAHGLKCRIIDKAPAPSDKSKALVVWSRTLELLDDLELAPRFIADGMKINGGSIYGDGKRIVHVTMAGVDSPFGFPLMIPQNETERLLTDHLARKGVAIERQIELLAFSEKSDSVVGKLRNADGTEESFETPWLIGCDGAHSTVRHTLGFEFTGSSEQNDWLLADVHLAGNLPRDEFSVFWHEAGVLVFFPITETRFRVIADLGAAPGSGAPPAPTLAEVQAIVDQRGPGGLTISEPIWLAGFRINERKVSDYRRGRVILAGDAAHIHSPAGGQGMNTGMQDAFNLGWKIALAQRGQGQAEPLLNSYSVERSAVGDQVLQDASVLTNLATLRNPVAQFARNHVAGLLSSFGFVKDKFRNQLCELSINYRHSPALGQRLATPHGRPARWRPTPRRTTHQRDRWQQDHSLRRDPQHATQATFVARRERSARCLAHDRDRHRCAAGFSRCALAASYPTKWRGGGRFQVEFPGVARHGGKTTRAAGRHP